MSTFLLLLYNIKLMYFFPQTREQYILSSPKVKKDLDDLDEIRENKRKRIYPTCEQNTPFCWVAFISFRLCRDSFSGHF